MSLWQLMACVVGWNEAHGADDDKPAPPTREEFYDMVERLT